MALVRLANINSGFACILSFCSDAFETTGIDHLRLL